MALQNAFGDLALDSSVQEGNEVLSTLKELNQNLVQQNKLFIQMFKMMRSLGNTDTSYRQRVVVDNTITATVATVTTVTTVTTVGSVTNIAAIAGMGFQQFQAPLRTAYNTGIRSKFVRV